MKLLPPTQELRNRLSRLCFLLALACFTLGFLITFYPGDELHWFTFVACLFLFVFLISRGSDYRVIAAVFLILSLIFAFWGYRRGVHYRAWLAEHPIIIPFTKPSP
jgi:hypothetical protein